MYFKCFGLLVSSLFYTLFLLTFGPPVWAEEVVLPSDIRAFSLHATGGVTRQSWDSGLQRAAVEVETESLEVFRVEGRLAFQGRTLLSLAHSRSLSGTWHQQQMLAASWEKQSSLTETLGVLDLLAWVAGSEKGLSGELDFLDRLLGLRFTYTNDLHYGRTASQSDFVYVDFTGLDNAQIFRDGQQLGFRTTFRDLRIQVPVLFDRLYPGAVTRVGFFRSRWEKLASLPEDYLDGYPVVQDTRRDISGLNVSYDNSLDWPGIGWGLSLDLGLLGTGLTIAEDRDEDSKPTYSAFTGELRWNFGYGVGRSGLAATVGTSLQWRGWKQDGQDLDRDFLVRVFGRVGFDLVL